MAGCSSSGTTGNDDAPSNPTPAPSPGPKNPDDPKKDPTPVDPTTEMVIGVDSEAFASQGFMIGAVDFTAKIDGVVAVQETVKRADVPAIFPHEIRIRPPATKPEADVDIEVVARDTNSGSSTNPMPPIVSRLAHAKFVKGKTTLAYVFLEIRCNTFPMMGGSAPSGPTCAAPTTCIAGSCTSADLGPLPDYRADWRTNPPSACGNGAPSIDIAQGESTVDGLADGTTLELEEGPQCGHHVWIATKMTGLSQSGTTTTLSAAQPGSSITVPATGFPYAYASKTAGSCEIAGLRFQVDISGAKAADFLGKPLDIAVEATDKAGRKATAIRHVQIASTMKTIPGRNCP